MMAGRLIVPGKLTSSAPGKPSTSVVFKRGSAASKVMIFEATTAPSMSAVRVTSASLLVPFSAALEEPPAAFDSASLGVMDQKSPRTSAPL